VPSPGVSVVSEPAGRTVGRGLKHGAVAATPAHDRHPADDSSSWRQGPEHSCAAPLVHHASPNFRGSAGDDRAAGHGGRDEAARRLWEEHYPALAGWCAALTGDSDCARDIASEAFTRLLSKWTTVRDPRGYLYVTAHNLVRDRWRRQERERRLHLHLQAAKADRQAEADPWLRELAEQLPERMRLPVLLHYFADMPIAQVASALHRPQGTVKRTLCEARHQLRSWLEQADASDLPVEESVSRGGDSPELAPSATGPHEAGASFQL
jgi:RNA polymerase sigma-70 factor, ECF subfamily